MRAFAALRAWNLLYYQTLSPADREKVGHHPERGEESVGMLLRMQAGHDRNHLAQLETIARMPPSEPVSHAGRPPE